MTMEARIRADIEGRIHSGAWRPGDRIPFEHELVTSYGCSRGTVSKALGALAKSGLIERRRKAGSFVAHPHVHSAVLEVPDLAELIAARGETYRWQLSATRIANATEARAVPQPALLVQGIHFGSGEPFAIESRTISLATVPAAADADFGKEAPGTWLLRHVPWTAAQHRIRAIEASRKEAEALGVRAHMACLELERLTWRAGEPVTQVRQLFRGDRFDLVAEFKPSSTLAATGGARKRSG